MILCGQLQVVAILGWFCALVLLPGCAETRLLSWAPRDPNLEKRSYDLHDPFPDEGAGPETEWRPRAFTSPRAETRRARELRTMQAAVPRMAGPYVMGRDGVAYQTVPPSALAAVPNPGPPIPFAGVAPASPMPGGGGYVSRWRNDGLPPGPQASWPRVLVPQDRLAGLPPGAVGTMVLPGNAAFAAPSGGLTPGAANSRLVPTPDPGVPTTASPQAETLPQ